MQLVQRNSVTGPYDWPSRVLLLGPTSGTAEFCRWALRLAQQSCVAEPHDWPSEVIGGRKWPNGVNGEHKNGPVHTTVSPLAAFYLSLVNLSQCHVMPL